MRVRILLFHGSLQEAEQGTLPDSLFEVSIPDASQTKAVQEKKTAVLHLMSLHSVSCTLGRAAQDPLWLVVVSQQK